MTFTADLGCTKLAQLKFALPFVPSPPPFQPVPAPAPDPCHPPCPPPSPPNAAVNRNLLLRFKDDSVDETPTLAQLLQTSSTLSEVLDISVRTLPGDHLRLMHQAIVDLPPEVARLASSAVHTGGDFIGEWVSSPLRVPLARLQPAPTGGIRWWSAHLVVGFH